MAYTSEVIRRATALLERRRTAHQSRQRMLQAEIYDVVPEVRAIDDQLHAGMRSLAAAAFHHGVGPATTVESVRRENLALQERRRILLAENGYEADCLDSKPLCPRCDDRGWIGATMCQCLKELCAQEQIKGLSSLLDLGEQSFETFSLDWYSTDYSEALGMSPRDNMDMVYKICQNYAHKFGKYLVHNLFLTGDPGLGKTFLSACIARVVCEKDFSVVYDTAVNVFTHFENAKFGRSEDAPEAVHRYLSCDLLILDDLGSELTSTVSQSSLYTIINSRLMADKHTVISSNLSMDDIRLRYQPMIASRIEGEYRELTFAGQDIRVLRKDGRR